MQTDPYDDLERRELDQLTWEWTHCPHCNEDYRMPSDAGNCLTCGESLDVEKK